MKHKLLIFEPQEELASVLELMFGENFDVESKNSVDETKKHITNERPNVALIDASIGLSAIEEITKFSKDLPAVDEPSIIVLGEKTEDSEIAKIFNAGVADFVEKPFNVVAFHKRMLRYSRDIESVRKLHESDQRKNDIAQTAMKQSSTYGSGFELLAKLNTVHSVDGFLATVTKAIAMLGYNNAVEFRFKDESYSLDSDIGECSEVEERIFQLLHDKGRIYSFSNRMMFNDQQSSILIKNMPVSGTPSYDAAIDLFAKLIPALDAKFISLMNHITMRESSDTLQRTIDMIREQLTHMEISRKDNLNEVANAINLSFHELEMTEVQESFFINLVEKITNDSDSNSTFQQIVDLLSDCASKLHVDVAEETPEAEAHDDDDMELF